MQKMMKKSKEDEEKEHWVVCGLVHDPIDHVLYAKALPFDVYRAIHAHYLSQEDAAETQYCTFEHAGWNYDAGRDHHGINEGLTD